MFIYIYMNYKLIFIFNNYKLRKLNYISNSHTSLYNYFKNKKILHIIKDV